MKKTLFIKNTAALTLSGLILRFAGIIFKIWTASHIGKEGMGLYQVVFSVYVLFAALSTTGISTAVTRLCAEELSLGSKRGVRKIMRCCIIISVISAVFSFVVLFRGADFISLKILKDPRCSLSIKILSFSLPFMGMSSVFKGYFTARRESLPNALSQIFEQSIRIAAVVLIFARFEVISIENRLAALLFADTVAEILSFLFCYIAYILDKNKINYQSGRSLPPYRVMREIMRISLPLTASRYLNSLLRTTENVLMPHTLSLHSSSPSQALSIFGMIKGMALPILFFPSSLLNAVTTLLIPEMAESLARKRSLSICRMSEKAIRITALLGLLAGSIFFVAGEELGVILYKDIEVGRLLKWLSPIVPLMYLDSVCDGLLKGLDRQKYTFFSALSDSTIRIFLILLIVPRSGIMGFIGIMYFSNLFTFLLHLLKLIRVSGAAIKLKDNFLMPGALCLSTALFADFLFKGLLGLDGLVYIIPLIFTCCVCYYFMIKWLNFGKIF